MVELVDFYADWCGPCHAMKPILADIEKEYNGKLTIKRVDVEEDMNMASKYGIQSIPTFVILENGVEKARRLGAVPKEVFKSWIDSSI